MPKQLANVIASVQQFLLIALLLLVPYRALAAERDTRPNCTSNATIEACVTSAALSNDGNAIIATAVKVSITLRITNKTDYPIGLAIARADPSFDPENAPSITSATDFHPSGIMIGQYTEFAPGQPTSVHITYGGYIHGNDAQMIQSATVASFSISLVVSDRGNQRLIPISVSEFHFGNGFARY